MHTPYVPRKNRKGAAFVEYVALMALIAVVVIFAIVQFSGQLNDIFGRTNSTITQEIEDNTDLTITDNTQTPGGGGGPTTNEPQAGDIVIAEAFATVYRSDGGNYFNLADQMADWATSNSAFTLDATYFSGMSWSYTFQSGDIGTLTSPQFNANGIYGAAGWDNGQSCAVTPYPNTDTVLQRATSTGPNGETWEVDVMVGMTDYIC